jgi:hypothetical protein
MKCLDGRIIIKLKNVVFRDVVPSGFDINRETSAHSAISQKKAFFIAAAVKTSNPTIL